MCSGVCCSSSRRVRPADSPTAPTTHNQDTQMHHNTNIMYYHLLPLWSPPIPPGTPPKHAAKWVCHNPVGVKRKLSLHTPHQPQTVSAPKCTTPLIPPYTTYGSPRLVQFYHTASKYHRKVSSLSGSRRQEKGSGLITYFVAHTARPTMAANETANKH